MTAALEGSEWSAARPGRTWPPGKTRYPLYRRLGGPQGRSERAENLVPTGMRSPDLPARSQSLYRLSYRANIMLHMQIYITSTYFTHKTDKYTHLLWTPLHQHCGIPICFGPQKAIFMEYDRFISTTKSTERFTTYEIQSRGSHVNEFEGRNTLACHSADEVVFIINVFICRFYAK